MNHLQTWQAENVSLHSCDHYLGWLADIQSRAHLTDSELDGDRNDGNLSPDIACLDELFDWYDAGMSVSQVSGILLDRIQCQN